MWERPLVKTILGTLLLLIGVIGLAVLLLGLARDVSLWVFGRPIEAEVIELWAEEISEEGDAELNFRYFVRYRFSTPDGVVITRVSPVAAAEWAGLGHAARDFDRASGEGVEPDSAAGVYQERQHVPQDTLGGLEVGGTISIVYFSLYPAHNRLDESRFMPVLICAYLPLLFLVIASLVGGYRVLKGAIAEPVSPWESQGVQE